MNIVTKDVSVIVSLGGILGCIIGLLIAFGTSSIIPQVLNPSTINQFYGACTFFGVFGGMSLAAFVKFALNILTKNKKSIN